MKHNKDTSFDPIKWINENVNLKDTNAADFLYDDTESQSGECLPVIYQPFDGRKPGHFADRGHILDFALNAGNGRVLDFGPGDGWPSLLIAPMVKEVVGVDGSARRVEVCTRNAERLGINNVSFVHVPPRERLPFDDESFDGITAASSIEQTPDPKATLNELHRILKQNGKLRMHYESLSDYRGDKEREISLGWGAEKIPTRVIIFDRHIDEEYVRHYGLELTLTRSEIKQVFTRNGEETSFNGMTEKVLCQLCENMVEAATWTTQHPSCRTFLRWLKETGFTSATPTYNGGWFARCLFDRLDESRIPQELEEVDNLLHPLVEVVITLDAPLETRCGQWDPWITAVK